MPIQSKLLRDQAARFLALSTKAREEGDSDLADLFTEAAADCLGKIVAAECAEASAPHVDARQPVAQQQQQIQSDKKET